MRYLTLLLLLLYAISCSHINNSNKYSKEQRLIADYGSFPFEKWCDWNVSYRDGSNYYLACYVQDSIVEKVIFMPEDSIKVLMTSSIGKADQYLSLHGIALSGQWKRFYSFCEYDSFCSIATFIKNNDLHSVIVSEDCVVLKGFDFELRKSLSNRCLIDSLVFSKMGDEWYVKRK